MTNLELARYIKHRRALGSISLSDNSIDDDVLITKEIELYLQYKRKSPRRKALGGGFGMAALAMYLMDDKETKFFENIIHKASSKWNGLESHKPTQILKIRGR